MGVCRRETYSANQVIDWTEFCVRTIHSTNIPAIALRASRLRKLFAQLALTTQEGDVVVRTDQNRTYMKNSGTAGSMADFTQILTPTDYVSASSGGTFSSNVGFTGNVTQNTASLATGKRHSNETSGLDKENMTAPNVVAVATITAKQMQIPLADITRQVMQ